MTGRVLLVDDEAAVRAALAQTLDLAGFEVESVADGAAALKAAAREAPGVVLSDMRMPRMDGFALLAALTESDPDLPVIFLTGHGDVPMAVKAIGAGAYDFLEKPADGAELVERVRRALDRRALALENRALRTRLEAADILEAPGAPLILGDAPASITYRQRLKVLAGAEADVLIQGETGAGKEGAARAIHRASDRKGGPFVVLNCAVLSAEAAASELFGHEVGAFPGARTPRRGKFEAANGGVVFLDEIESLDLDLQARLLRVLQEREVERLGGRAPIPLDIRVIAATKADLAEEAAAGRFREDLYYRLDVARLRVPPLRERAADAPLLFAYFVKAAAKRAGTEPPEVGPDLAGRLVAHAWPGNIRELKNAAERYAEGLGHGLGAATPADAAGRSLTEQVDAFEKAVIAEALAAAGGRVAQAAEALGAPRKTLYDKLAKHRINAGDFRS